MKRILKVLVLAGAVFGMNLAMARSAEALEFAEGQTYDSSCEINLFGMRPWYAGLSVKDGNGRCMVGTPKDDNEMATMVWIIILNVMSDITILVGYIALGFMIYGGYMYILSSGEPAKVAKGKKAITGAVIGLAIVLLATVIVNTILRILGV